MYAAPRPSPRSRERLRPHKRVQAEESSSRQLIDRLFENDAADNYVRITDRNMARKFGISRVEGDATIILFTRKGDKAVATGKTFLGALNKIFNTTGEGDVKAQEVIDSGGLLFVARGSTLSSVYSLNDTARIDDEALAVVRRMFRLKPDLNQDVLWRRRLYGDAQKANLGVLLGRVRPPKEKRLKV